MMPVLVPIGKGPTSLRIERGRSRAVGAPDQHWRRKKRGRRERKGDETNIGEMPDIQQGQIRSSPFLSLDVTTRSSTREKAVQECPASGMKQMLTLAAAPPTNVTNQPPGTLARDVIVLVPFEELILIAGRDRFKDKHDSAPSKLGPVPSPSSIAAPHACDERPDSLTRHVPRYDRRSDLRGASNNAILTRA